LDTDAAAAVAAVAPASASRYIPQIGNPETSAGIAMRAETQSIVEEIKQSVGLLRRHL
jgi:hypothetical protein